MVRCRPMAEVHEYLRDEAVTVWLEYAARKVVFGH
jgi:hypothetical protein